MVNNMTKELESLNELFDLVTCQDSFEKGQKCYDIIEEALQRLESIDNAKPSKALEELNYIGKNYYTEGIRVDIPCILYAKNYIGYDIIKNTLIKAQKQEKENEVLKEIIKSLFDRGCPLHQYTDSEGTLLIEVDDECSIMRLGEFKGVDLDKKLKEVLK